MVYSEHMRLKFLGEIHAGAGFPEVEQGDLTNDIPFFKVGDAANPTNLTYLTSYQHTISNETRLRLRAYLFPKESIVFAKIGAALLLNKRRIIPRPSCVDNNMAGFVPKSVFPKWAYWCLCDVDFADLVNPGAVPSLNEGILNNISVFVPSESVQRQLSYLLDSETSRIDALISKKERQIELLQEKRQAIITHAVTKGLDPNAKMKDSGVEWIGEIPSHWEALELKRKWTVIDCKHKTAEYTDEGYPVISTTEVKPGRLSLNTQRRTTEECYFDLIGDSRKPEKGDLIYSRNASLGVAAFVETEAPFCMGQDVCLVKSRSENQLFLMYYLNSSVANHQLQLFSIGSTFSRINVEQIKKMIICHPPMTEQVAIAKFLDLKQQEIGSLIEKIADSISIIQEYRSSLITSAVSGHIDVSKMNTKAPE
jgi:type I restriction enzyme, S subunit